MPDIAKREAYYKAYRLAHCEQQKAKSKLYRLTHKKEIAAYELKRKEQKKINNKAYAIANKDKLAKYRRLRHLSHYSNLTEEQKEVYRINRRLYCLSNKERIAEYSRKYYHLKAKLKDNYKIVKKIYYLDNQEKLREYGVNYHKLNPEKINALSRKRRALKLGNHHEPYTDNYIYERDNWTCGICGQKINKRIKYPHPRSKSIDHILAISKGGADAPINLQAAHLICNVHKNAGNGGQLRLIG
jgi:DNA repair ATPase RecN